MAEKKTTVTYKEPGSYFNEGMKKAAEKWEKENAKKKADANKKKK